jgi:glutathione S-transferase
MMKLYHGPGACSFVPLACLERVRESDGIDFEVAPVKLHKGEQLSAEYLALNPRGQVPLLLVDGKPLTQVMAIVGYLEQRFPKAHLLPVEPFERAQTVSTLAWFNNTVHTTFTHIFMPQKFAATDEAKAEVKRHNLALFRQQLGEIDGMAARAAPFLTGHQFSPLDAYALTFLRWAGLAGIDPTTLPNYWVYVQKLATYAPVERALAADRVPLNTYKPAA